MEVGGVPVVVRASTPDVAARLEERLAPWVIPHPGQPAEISLAASVHEDGRRTTNSVHRRGFTVRTTHSVDEALETVEALLHTFGPVPPGCTPMLVRALERDGAVVLVSDTFRETVDGHHRRFERAGYRTWPHTPVLVDPLTVEALLPAGPPGAGRWRRVPITAVVVFAPEATATDSPAVRITHLTALVAGRDAPTRGRDVAALVTLTRMVPFVRLDELAPNSVIDALFDR